MTFLRISLIFLLSGTGSITAQTAPGSWDVTQPRGETRTIDFETTEGTWMAVDISPDGRWLLFDLLGHIYRVSAEGGVAECLTQSSGIALNYHPRFSPDGGEIAFVSDRGGQGNLWIMGSDGSSPRAVFSDLDVRVSEPEWMPDGQTIVVRRQETENDEFGLDEFWVYHREGGRGIRLLAFPRGGSGAPSVSPDGRYLYYHDCTRAGARDSYGCDDFVKGATQLRRLEVGSGRIEEMTSGPGGGVAPVVSPDGRWLAFARRIPDGTITYKGHEFGPRTALWLRDLRTGAERIVMDPIETDNAERQHDIRPVFFIGSVLPAYSWDKESRSIVLSQGGKLRRLWIEDGSVETIPFQARVRREISQMAGSRRRLTEDPLEVRSVRWPTASPDGRRLAFQAVGRIWLMDLPDGTPRRLSSDDSLPFEYSPSWSPDGRWVAFTTFDGRTGGHLWKVRAEGGASVRLTSEAGEYVHPVWSPSGRELLIVSGSGASRRLQTWANNPWYEIARIPSDGGSLQLVARVASSKFNRGQIVRPSYGPAGRIYFPERRTFEEAREEPRTSPVPWPQEVTVLVSVEADGTDKREHLEFPYADEVVVSPDGRRVAFQEGDNVYVTPLDASMPPVRVFKGDASLPVQRLSVAGGLFPRWHDVSTVEFGSGDSFFLYRLPAGGVDTFDVRLRVPRRFAPGSIGLTGARIVLPHNGQVLEGGTVVVRDARIACVGDCATDGLDRVIDVSGKTVLPGFIDMHGHHHWHHQGILPRYNFESAVYLAFGVTTTLDPAAWSQNVFPSAELVEAGQVVGPRMFTTADPLYGGDAPRQDRITSYEVADRAVQRLQSWGAMTIKQYLQPNRAQRQWVIDAARKRGLPVTGEVNDHEYNLSMIMDGQDGFEHPLPYLVAYADVARFLGQAAATYSPTFVVGGAGAWNEDYFFQEGEVWKDARLRRFLPWHMVLPNARRRMLRPRTDYSFPFIAQGLADVMDAGGHGAIGGHGEQHGLGSHWEIWMAASALGPMRALEIATSGGARFLGMEGDLGSIVPGKIADLLVLNSNPLDDIRNTTDIRYVMKAGVLYDAGTLDEIWPEEKAYEGRHWVDENMLNSDARPIDYWDRKGN